MSLNIYSIPSSLLYLMKDFSIFGNLCWLNLKINQDSDAFSSVCENIFELSLAAIELENVP